MLRSRDVNNVSCYQLLQADCWEQLPCGCFRAPTTVTQTSVTVTRDKGTAHVPGRNTFALHFRPLLLFTPPSPHTPGPWTLIAGSFLCDQEMYNLVRTAPCARLAPLHIHLDGSVCGCSSVWWCTVLCACHSTWRSLCAESGCSEAAYLLLVLSAFSGPEQDVAFALYVQASCLRRRVGYLYNPWPLLL